MNKKKIIVEYFRTGDILYALFQGLHVREYLPNDIPYGINYFNIAPATYHTNLKTLPKGGYMLADIDGLKSFLYALRFADTKDVTQFVANKILDKYKNCESFLKDMIRTYNGSDIKEWYKTVRKVRIVWL